MRELVIGFLVFAFAWDSAHAQDPNAEQPWYCPKTDAVFLDQSGRPMSKELVTVAFKITRSDGSRVWTGEAWVEKAQLLPLPEALKHYSQTIVSGAADGEVYRRRAAIYRHRGELSFALFDYNRAIELSPDSALAYAGRGIVYRTQGSLDRALQDLDRAVELLPSHAAVRIARGNVYSSLGDHARAAQAYREAIELDESVALAHKNLAAELYLLKDFANALVHYDRAYALSKDVAILHDRALVYLATKDFASAMRDLNQGLAEQPNDVRLVSTLAVVHAASGETEKALAGFGQAISLDQANPMHWHNRGIMRLSQKQYASAVGDFSEALERDPTYVPSLLACARIFASSPDERNLKAEVAIACGLKALQATRFSSPAAYSAAASAYAAGGAFEDAIRCQQKAIELLQEGTTGERALLEQELAQFRARKRLTSLPVLAYEH